jgi:hypothetical protein
MSDTYARICDIVDEIKLEGDQDTDVYAQRLANVLTPTLVASLDDGSEVQVIGESYGEWSAIHTFADPARNVPLPLKVHADEPKDD